MALVGPSTKPILICFEIVTHSKESFVLAAKRLPRNHNDGHKLKECLEQAHRTSGYDTSSCGQRLIGAWLQHRYFPSAHLETEVGHYAKPGEEVQEAQRDCACDKLVRVDGYLACS